MDIYYRHFKNSTICILVISLFGCAGISQRKVAKLSNPCNSRYVETLDNGIGDPNNISILTATHAATDQKPIYSEVPAPCTDGQADSGANEDSGGIVATVKAGFAQAKNSFCPTSSESSDSYLALVRSQQDFCKSRNLEMKEQQKPYNSDRDIFRGLDGVLLKIVPFYIFNH